MFLAGHLDTICRLLLAYPHPSPLCAYGTSLALLGTALMVRPAPYGLVPQGVREYVVNG